MPIETDHSIREHLERLDAAEVRDGIEATVTAESVEVAVNRSWVNGWRVAAYAKAWWTGSGITPEAGVKVRKDF